MTPPITPAATVVLLREEADGFSVFLLKRSRRSGFMPSMWVYPGGRVEPDDGDLPAARAFGGASAVRAFGLDDRTGRAALLAGVRETFEEAGLWLGDGDLPQHLRLPLATGEVALGDVLAEHDDRVDLGQLRPFARWVTPVGERRRFDALFLLAVSPEGEGSHCAHETVDSGWYRPADVLGRGIAEMGLAPPTWWTLQELARFGSVDEVLASSAGRDLRPVEPVLDRSGPGFAILLPGHPGHPADGRPGLPTRIGMSAGGWSALDAPFDPLV